MLNSIRTRLMIWNIGIMGLLLALFSTAFYIGLCQSFNRHEKRILIGWMQNITKALAQDTSAMPHDQIDSRIAGLRLAERHVTILRPAQRGLPEKVVYGPDSLSSLPSNWNSVNLGEIRFDLAQANNPGMYGVGYRRIVISRITLANGEDYVVMTSRSLDPLDAELLTNRRVLLVLFPCGLLLAGIAAWFLVGKSLGPVAAMSRKAREIEAGNLDQRLPVGNPRDEVGELACVINDLLARLNTSFNLQLQFMADASHELRTPVSVIRTAAAVTLMREHRGEEEYRDVLLTIGAQSDRLTRIVNDMFQLARADSSGITLQRHDFYLDEMVEQTVHAVRHLSASKNIRLETEITGECPYNGDTDLLQRMIMNLLDNAIKYTPRHGKIRVQLQSSTEAYIVRVADNGAGIAPENRERVFQRFFREPIEISSSGATMHSQPSATLASGAGLGLAIALSIAESHGGSLALDESGVAGTTFVASLPRHLA